PVRIVVAGGPTRSSARRIVDWAALAIALFDEVHATGGVFHVWGHSWEIDQRHDWQRLERVLTHISRRDDVRYVTNSDLAGGRTENRRATRPVVQVVSYYPPHVGGTENVACTLAETLAERRPVEVLTSPLGGGHRSVERSPNLTVRRLLAT